MEVTKEQYERALDVLSKVALAQKAVQAYEEQQKWVNNPIQEIIEQGKPEFISGEVIRNNPMLWRASKIRYVHEKGTVERTISYASNPESKNLIQISTDEKILL
jgi:hypothetical protein